MEAVLDTNVLVSGLLRANGPPGEILDLVFGGVVSAVFDDRILYEYREVLARPRFAFPAPAVDAVLSSLIALGRHVTALHLPVRLPDANDLCFYEAALSSDSLILVTGNKRHFPASPCRGITVCSPTEFLDRLSA